MIALDTNVFIDLQEGAPEVAEQALVAIDRAGSGALVICAITYAELCARPGGDASTIAQQLRAAGVAIDVGLPIEVWTDAGIAYAAFQRRREHSGNGASRRIIADFVIGAHASRIGTLVTSDAAFYRRAFPGLRVVDVRGLSSQRP